MRNLGGWSRLWVVFAGLWVSSTVILFSLNYPSVRSTDSYLRDQLGSYWLMSTSNAQSILEFRIAFPELHENETDQHALASRLTSAKLSDEIFELEIEHQVFVIVPSEENSSKIDQQTTAKLTVISPADESAFKDQLVSKFSSQPDSWIQSTAKKITIEAQEIEKRWPRRLSEELKADKRQVRNFLMGAAFFVFFPPLLLLIAIGLVRWVYQGFKHPQKGN